MKTLQIISLIITAPFWLFVGVIGAAWCLLIVIVGLMLGLVEYGFTGDKDLLEDLWEFVTFKNF